MISLVLPAYNPGSAVERTWHEVREFFQTRADSWEAIFVCDGCTDDSPERLQRLSDETNDPRMRFVAYSPNRGKGYAVRTGLQAARGQYRIFTDVDLAYRFEDVARVAEELLCGAQVAIASRAHPDSEMLLPVRCLGYAYRRRMQSAVFGKAARLLLSLQQRDTQAGLKGMTADVANRLLPEMTCNGFGFDCELLTACRIAAIPVTEVPVRVRYEDGVSTTGSGTVLKMLRELWRIRREWRGRIVPVLAPKRDVAPEPTRKAA